MASDVPPFVTVDRAYFRALLRYVRRLERDVPVVAVNLPSIASYDVLVPAMVATACATTSPSR